MGQQQGGRDVELRAHVEVFRCVRNEHRRAQCRVRATRVIQEAV